MAGFDNVVHFRSDDAPESTPELRMAIAQRLAELSGRTTREVLKDDVSDDQVGVAAGVGEWLACGGRLRDGG